MPWHFENPRLKLGRGRKRKKGGKRKEKERGGSASEPPAVSRSEAHAKNSNRTAMCILSEQQIDSFRKKRKREIKKEEKRGRNDAGSYAEPHLAVLAQKQHSHITNINCYLPASLRRKGKREKRRREKEKGGRGPRSSGLQGSRR